MIFLTKLNGEKFVLNADLIETVVEKPDTTIQLTTARFVIVRESMEEVVKQVIAYRRSIQSVQNFAGKN